MKHITEEYGEETNLIECSPEEFETLYAFLAKAGVRLRQTMRLHSSTGKVVVTAQAINAYEFFSDFSPDSNKISEQAKRAIAVEYWQL